MPDPRSALASITSSAIALAAGLSCEEKPMADLVMLSAWPGTVEKVFGTAGKKLEIDFPEDCRTASGSDQVKVFRVAPRRLMIVSETPDLLSPLRGVIAGEDGAISQQGHSRVRFRLIGAGAAALLSRGAPVDLDERVFPSGAFAQTSIHHMWVLIHKVAAEPEAFDLYVLRSFALSFWQWLLESVHIATQTPEGANSLAG